LLQEVLFANTIWQKRNKKAKPVKKNINLHTFIKVLFLFLKRKIAAK